VYLYLDYGDCNELSHTVKRSMAVSFNSDGVSWKKQLDVYLNKNTVASDDKIKISPVVVASEVREFFRNIADLKNTYDSKRAGILCVYFSAAYCRQEIRSMKDVTLEDDDEVIIPGEPVEFKHIIKPRKRN